MRKLAVFATLVAVIVAAGTFGKTCRAQSPWQPVAPDNSKMKIQVGAKVFDRPSVSAGGALVTDSITNSVLISNEQASDFGSNFGAEIKLNLPNRWGQDLEIRSILVNWDEEQSAGGPALVSDFFAPGAAVTPQTFNLSTEADFYSIELSKRRAVTPGISVFAGPRFISTGDRFTATSLTATGGATLTQTNAFEADNSLIGLQAGIELARTIAPSVYVTGFIRGGGYFNSTDVTSSVTAGAPGALPVEVRRDQSTESFVGDVGGKVHFEIVPNGLSTFVGYEATWIDGIALSAENLSGVGGVDTNNTVFFQAITFGVQLQY